MCDGLGWVFGWVGVGGVLGVCVRACVFVCFCVWSGGAGADEQIDAECVC